MAGGLVIGAVITVLLGVGSCGGFMEELHPFDVCPPVRKVCPCGKSGFLRIEVDMCLDDDLRNGGAICRPCDKLPFFDDDPCSKFQFCETCNQFDKTCASCLQGRQGKYCEKEEWSFSYDPNIPVPYRFPMAFDQRNPNLYSMPMMNPKFPGPSKREPIRVNSLIDPKLDRLSQGMCSISDLGRKAQDCRMITPGLISCSVPCKGSKATYECEASVGEWWPVNEWSYQCEVPAKQLLDVKRKRRFGGGTLYGGLGAGIFGGIGFRPHCCRPYPRPPCSYPYCSRINYYNRPSYNQWMYNRNYPVRNTYMPINYGCPRGRCY